MLHHHAFWHVNASLHFHSRRRMENDQIDGYFNVRFLLHIRYLFSGTDIQMDALSILVIEQAIRVKKVNLKLFNDGEHSEYIVTDIL